MKKLQCKDIADQPILQLLSRFQHCTLIEGFTNSVQVAMPADTPKNLVRAKMGSLIRRSLITGCACGCRGDFMLADKGSQMLADMDSQAAA